MDHLFVLNHYSFPAQTKSQACDLLIDMSKGMINIGKDGDRYVVYSDHDANINSFKVAPDFSFGDFVDELSLLDESDLQLALLEIQDKSPMLNNLPDEDIETISNSCFFFPDEGYASSVDILAVAWHIDATLLSIGSAEKWKSSEIEFAQYFDGAHDIKPAYIRNVSSIEHGLFIQTQYELSKSAISDADFPLCHFAQEFKDWFQSLNSDLKMKVRSKLELAHKKQFQGGEPLFDTLKNADGLREIRLDAVQGGAVRIIFGALPNSKFGIYLGFIKKSDAEGYKKHIPNALSIHKAMN